MPRITDYPPTAHSLLSGKIGKGGTWNWRTNLGDALGLVLPTTPQESLTGGLLQMGMSSSVKSPWELTRKSFKKSPWNMTISEYDNKFLGKWQAGVMTDDGKFITGYDHFDAMQKAERLGYKLSDPLGLRAGWRQAGEVVLDKDFPENNPDWLHLAFIRKAIREGKQVPKSVLDEYPDINALYGGTIKGKK